MTRACVRTLVLIVLGGCLGSCMAWHPISPGLPESHLPRARLFLTDGRTLEWREVQVGADSVRGVAEARTVALPRATVSRVEVRRLSIERSALLGVGAVGATYAWCWLLALGLGGECSF